LADLKFQVEAPIQVSIDYQPLIHVKPLMPVEITTDFIYQHQLLPQFSLKLNLPIKMDVPFHLKCDYTIPVQIRDDGSVYF
jgi:hypothetical protein